MRKRQRKKNFKSIFGVTPKKMKNDFIEGMLGFFERTRRLISDLQKANDNRE